VESTITYTGFMRDLARRRLDRSSTGSHGVRSGWASISGLRSARPILTSCRLTRENAFRLIADLTLDNQALKEFVGKGSGETIDGGQLLIERAILPAFE